MEAGAAAELFDKISFNSPVVLVFTALSLLVLIFDKFTDGLLRRSLFSVYKSSFLDPFAYIRLFGHAIGHSGIGHYIGNFMLILLLGPPLEEKYGNLDLFLMMFITAVVAGLFYTLLASDGYSVCGASGVVFMLIVLSSFTNVSEGKIPFTLILVSILYLGKELINEAGKITGLRKSGVAHLAHILGGVTGGVFGFYWPAIKNFIGFV